MMLSLYQKYLREQCYDNIYNVLLFFRHMNSFNALLRKFVISKFHKAILLNHFLDVRESSNLLLFVILC